MHVGVPIEADDRSHRIDEHRWKAAERRQHRAGGVDQHFPHAGIESEAGAPPDTDGREHIAGGQIARLLSPGVGRCRWERCRLGVKRRLAVEHDRAVDAHRRQRGKLRIARHDRDNGMQLPERVHTLRIRCLCCRHERVSDRLRRPAARDKRRRTGQRARDDGLFSDLWRALGTLPADRDVGQVPRGFDRDFEALAVIRRLGLRAKIADFDVNAGAEVEHPEQADANAGLDQEHVAGRDRFVAPLAANPAECRVELQLPDTELQLSFRLHHQTRDVRPFGTIDAVTAKGGKDRDFELAGHFDLKLQRQPCGDVVVLADRQRGRLIAGVEESAERRANAVPRDPLRRIVAKQLAER
jgi:hypothetical protein